MPPKRRSSASAGAWPADAVAANGERPHKVRKVQSLDRAVLELCSMDELQITGPQHLESAFAGIGIEVHKRLGFNTCRWQLPVKAFGDAQEALGHACCTADFPPLWALAALGPEFRRHPVEMGVPRRTYGVLRKDKPESRRPAWMLSPQRFPRGCGWPTSLDELRSTDGSALLPYQKEGIEFGLHTGGRVLLGDEMGLGKTVQALVLASHYIAEWPLLVVAPSSLCRAWVDEALKWLPQGALGPGEQAIQLLLKGADVLRRLARVVVVSYDLLARHPQFQVSAKGEPFQVIICDEAHFLKNMASQRTCAVAPLVRQARRAILLTGTPAVNNAAELFPLLDSLLPGLVPSQVDFLKRYCVEHQIPGPYRGRRATVWRGSKRPHELHRFLSSTVMIRRLKNQVLTQLPDKRRQRVSLDRSALRPQAMAELRRLRGLLSGSATPSVRTRGDTSGGSLDGLVQQLAGMEPEASAVVENSANAPTEVSEGAARSIQSVVQEMAKYTCEAKIEAVSEYVECVVMSGVRFLLFAHHRAMLDALEGKLTRLGTAYIRIDGSTPMPRRAELVAEFQGQDSVQVALLSITACGQGLNLQAASVVLFAELHWVVGQMMQAEDRVHRVGQASAVNVQYLLAPGTLDDAMYEALKRKHLDTTATVDGQRQALRAEKLRHRGPAVELPSSVAEQRGRYLLDMLRKHATGAVGKSGIEVVEEIADV